VSRTFCTASKKTFSSTSVLPLLDEAKVRQFAAFPLFRQAPLELFFRGSFGFAQLDILETGEAEEADGRTVYPQFLLRNPQDTEHPCGFASGGLAEGRPANLREKRMTTTRAVLISSLIITGTILAHAYITQPRYHFSVLHEGAYAVVRGDAITGEMIVCKRESRPDGVEFYKCSP